MKHTIGGYCTECDQFELICECEDEREAEDIDFGDSPVDYGYEGDAH
jgi:hypothetical protein